MPEFGGLESFTPSEGGASASEGVSESAKQRFAQAQQQIKQIAKEEKKARKRDDRVATTIRQFLDDDRYAHLFPLISRLAAMDCPSIFILAVLSLIHQESLETVEDYIAEHTMVLETPDMTSLVIAGKSKLAPELQEKILFWTARLELIMSTDAERILSRLMVDEGNIDGAVLQVTTFVLVDFFHEADTPIPYEELQPLTIKILQDILEPYMEVMEKHFAALRAEKEGPPDAE
ncbi:MAG: hypothetical protein KBA40_01295 [Candidatus Peribacteraceae bacterium]|nr:hypothetical protein [Candidatus Peribacteraceae bacterium]MBP9850258.1 hypothetical protein [Candidatus Peribacteraceae bacterium]